MRPSDRQRAGDVVAVADVRDRDAVQVAEALAQREQVGERLARVVQRGEAVDDRYLRGVRELGNRRVRASPDHDRVDVARQHPGRVPDRLARVRAAARRRGVRAGARRAPRSRPETRCASLLTAARRPAPPSVGRVRPRPAPRSAPASARQPARAASRAGRAESSSPVRKWRGGSFKRGILRWMELRALTWNLFHGRDFPPDPSLLTLRSRLLCWSERNDTHLQLNRDLFDEFAGVLAGAPWDVALLQESPPRWSEALARACGATAHRVLTSRNSFAALASARRPRQPRPDRLERGRLEPDPRPRRADRRAPRARAVPGSAPRAAGDGVHPRAPRRRPRALRRQPPRERRSGSAAPRPRRRC